MHPGIFRQDGQRNSREDDAIGTSRSVGEAAFIIGKCAGSRGVTPVTKAALTIVEGIDLEACVHSLHYFDMSRINSALLHKIQHVSPEQVIIDAGEVLNGPICRYGDAEGNTLC